MSETNLTVVCLPPGTTTDTMADAATARVAAHALHGLGPAGHFLTRTRRRRRRLLQPWQNTAAGGPVQLLDLDAMRAAAHQRYAHRWAVWQLVVAGTRPAQPYWTFVYRHLDNPVGYRLHRARRDYLAQPRVAAMRTYNALPHKVTALPTRHLEVFQTGGQSYACYGWLSAIPGDQLICPDGGRLAPASDEHAVRLSYLQQANAVIEGLRRDDILVAVGTD